MPLAFLFGTRTHKKVSFIVPTLELSVECFQVLTVDKKGVIKANKLNKSCNLFCFRHENYGDCLSVNNEVSCSLFSYSMT